MLALIKNNTFVRQIPEDSRFEIDGMAIMPAQAGWFHGDYSLHKIQPANLVPEGKIVINTTVDLVDGYWTYVHTLGDEYLPTTEEIRADMPPLTARQLRLGLVSASILPAQVDAAIAAIPDETARAIATIEWEYAGQFERLHPLIDQIGGAFSLSPDSIDGMWLAASEL